MAAKKSRRSRRRARSNFYSAGVGVNRPRRRRRSSSKATSFFGNRRRRRTYRNNPQLLGFTLPPFDVVAWSAAGLIAPGMVSGWIMPLIPTSWKTNADGSPNQITNFAVKGAAVLLPSLAVRSFFSKRGGNIMLIAGAASLIVQAVKTFAPTFSTQIGLGYQPMLGEYIPPRQLREYVPQSKLRAVGMGAGPGMPPITRMAPNRLDPSERF